MRNRLVIVFLYCHHIFFFFKENILAGTDRSLKVTIQKYMNDYQSTSYIPMEFLSFLLCGLTYSEDQEFLYEKKKNYDYYYYDAKGKERGGRY